MTASHVQCNEPEKTGAIHKLMAHSRRTAEISYKRSSLTNTAATARVPLVNLLPARVIWINMRYLQYIEQEYLAVATC